MFGLMYLNSYRLDHVTYGQTRTWMAVRELADEIIEAQVREIGEMKRLIADLERNPPPAGSSDWPSYRRRANARE